ncbi:hypothetical protein IAG41_07430 [Sphingomonas sp. JC676]|uniref:hypothetical protein n=1 Tax=Sphingomonas sp. JC676 TaxID=2768065 RepID=UPI001658185E|nr:hypothetical protein [Sphingomonas sp. JC676]MBC9032217.1 hypothetical protein [Sphingomonas sp. JC676]
MADDTRIIAVGLLTARDLERLGQEFRRVYPVEETPCFGELLSAIDDADRKMWEEHDKRHVIVVQKMPPIKA